MLREASEIRSQSVEEEEDGFIEEDCSIDWASPPIYDTYPNEEVSSIHQVDFLGVDAILSKTFNQSCDEIYGGETTFLLKSEWIFVSSLGILIECGKDKARQGHGRGKDNLNSRSNSLQLEENDVDGMPTNIRPFDR
jgi:hypothetical protein